MTAKEFAAFLREVADFIEQHPDIPIPKDSNEITLNYTVNEIPNEQIAAMLEKDFDLRRADYILRRAKRLPHGTLEVSFPDIQNFPGAKPAQ